jgi:hypothetical protein
MRRLIDCLLLQAKAYNFKERKKKMATKLTLMEMRFSKSLTNTSYIKQSDTKSSSLALIRSLRMNDSAYSLRNAERDDMMLRMLKNA